MFSISKPLVGLKKKQKNNTKTTSKSDLLLNFDPCGTCVAQGLCKSRRNNVFSEWRVKVFMNLKKTKTEEKHLCICLNMCPSVWP